MEAYSDRGRYIILQRIGASKKQIKHIVTKQLALIFGVPLFIAIIHSSVALTIYVRYLGATRLGIESVVCMVMVYAVVYSCCYFLSVKKYIKIIDGYC